MDWIKKNIPWLFSLLVGGAAFIWVASSNATGHELRITNLEKDAEEIPKIMVLEVKLDNIETRQGEMLESQTKIYDLLLRWDHER